MQEPKAWDWTLGERTIIESVAPLDGHNWQEELQASPDGEAFAAIVNVGEAEFSVRVNDDTQESTFEKIWNLRFTSDGRLTAFVQEDGEWGLLVDGDAGEERYGYLWAPKWNADNTLAVSMQQDGEYGMLVNGEPWETLYEAATDFVLCPHGTKTAAVVQTVSLGQADVVTFQEGAYSVAVDGEAWDTNFVNCWKPCFSADAEHIAATIRKNLYDYSIAVDGKAWEHNYQMAWEPIFNPANDAVAAPVRQGGNWGVAIDDKIAWEPAYFQCWKLQYSADGENLWGIVAPEYGQFTMAQNNKPWSFRALVVPEFALSKDGKHAAALACSNNVDWRIVVDDAAWDGCYDMAWLPIFSEDGKHVAARIERNGKYEILVDGKSVAEPFDVAFDPTFSPDSTKLMLRGVRNGKALRIVMQIK